MRTAFSTLGCPNANLPEVIDLATSHGIDGLELRVHDGGIVSESMSPADASKLRRCLTQAGLTVLGLATYIKVCGPEEDDVEGKLSRSIELAAMVGARSVRVFPGAGMLPAAENQGLCDAEQRGAARLSQASALAEQVGVHILLETHDSHPRGADVARILSHAPSSHYIGAIWDVLHPWRHGEDPDETVRHLGRHLAYVQVKDALLDSTTGEERLVLPGAGHVPLTHILALLQDHGSPFAEPWASLEWEKAWNPGLPDMSIALPLFMSTIGSARIGSAREGLTDSNVRSATWP